MKDLKQKKFNCDRQVSVLVIINILSIFFDQVRRGSQRKATNPYQVLSEFQGPEGNL
jgi:hypothetical protein